VASICGQAMQRKRRGLRAHSSSALIEPAACWVSIFITNGTMVTGGGIRQTDTLDLQLDLSFGDIAAAVCKDPLARRRGSSCVC